MTPWVMEIPEFDLPGTLGSGQVFHWEYIDPSWTGLIHQTPVRLEQISKTKLLVSSPNSPHPKAKTRIELAIREYFSFDHSLQDIYASFPEDSVLNKAIHICRGLRIIRQPRWECLATFITSPMKRVEHIRQMSLAIRRCFGTPVEGSSVNIYPSAEVIAGVSEEALRGCGLGFRAKSLRATARAIADRTVDLELIAAMDTEAARAKLCELPGVGRKVANCVLLFAFERLDAVPVDVWIGRILKTRYLSRRRKLTPERMEAFSLNHFGPFAGYAQQYLFHHARVHES